MITMPQLDRAFAAARNDLASVGLLAEGLYLDHIECVRSPLPAGLLKLDATVGDQRTLSLSRLHELGLQAVDYVGLAAGVRRCVPAVEGRRNRA